MSEAAHCGPVRGPILPKRGLVYTLVQALPAGHATHVCMHMQTCVAQPFRAASCLGGFTLDNIDVAQSLHWIGTTWCRTWPGCRQARWKHSVCCALYAYMAAYGPAAPISPQARPAPAGHLLPPQQQQQLVLLHQLMVVVVHQLQAQSGADACMHIFQCAVQGQSSLAANAATGSRLQHTISTGCLALQTRCPSC
jgi:hypothetical protein